MRTSPWLFRTGAIVKQYTSVAGRDPQEFGDCSLRAEFGIAAVGREGELTRIMEMIWHRDLRTPMGSVRRANRVQGHAGASSL